MFYVSRNVLMPKRHLHSEGKKKYNGEEACRSLEEETGWEINKTKRVVSWQNKMGNQKRWKQNLVSRVRGFIVNSIEVTIFIIIINSLKWCAEIFWAYAIARFFKEGNDILSSLLRREELLLCPTEHGDNGVPPTQIPQVSL